jgi:hypothetical protein
MLSLAIKWEIIIGNNPAKGRAQSRKSSEQVPDWDRTCSFVRGFGRYPRRPFSCWQK